MFFLSQSDNPSALDWLARLADVFDARILARLVQLAGGDPAHPGCCWMFYGASGRQESLTMALPSVALIFSDARPAEEFRALYQRVIEGLVHCGYIPAADPEFDPSFPCASLADWKARFRGWVQDPVMNRIYTARPLFDLRPVVGARELWTQLEADVRAEIGREIAFLPLLAHDCMGNLPPLTFFQDLVVEETGEHRDMFHLERSALRPLVDVGRVFGLAAGRVLGSSTLERLALARAALPEHELIFREAAGTLRVILHYQARAGIRRHTDGTELPPQSLSRYDRQVLKSGFRSILRLLEFTAARRWLGGR
jgi:CBS domain-containing protein